MTNNIFAGKNISPLHGTTTVGLIFRDGVVIAADKRASMQNIIASKQAKKIHKINEYTAITISGVVADAQILIRWLQTQAQVFYLNVGRAPLIKELVNLLANVMHSYFKSLVPFISHFIVGGVDALGPHIIFLDHAGSIQEEKFIATGSGSPMALGVLESNFTNNLDQEAAITLALNALRSAILRDVYSGDGFDVVVITQESGVKFLSKEEKEKYLNISSLSLST